jgi:vitamin B12/bleomycin/antimicrobial peptide transport system ATP-binding/permease protein
VLQRLKLDHLMGGGWQCEREWDATLSLGEQQRLSIARALLHRPGEGGGVCRCAKDPVLVFLDEATSALDADAEAACYGLLKEAG